MRWIAKSAATLVLLLLLVLSTSAAETPRAKPDDVGISAQRLQRIHELMQRCQRFLRSSDARFAEWTHRSSRSARPDGHRNAQADDDRCDVSDHVDDEAYRRHSSVDVDGRRQDPADRPHFEVYPGIQESQSRRSSRRAATSGSRGPAWRATEVLHGAG